MQYPTKNDAQNQKAGENNNWMWTQLQNAIKMRSSEDQILWIIFGIFWAVNAVLLVALFRDGGLPDDSGVGVVVSLVGIFMSVTWCLIQFRTLGRVKKYEALMEKLEQTLNFPSEYAISGKINKDAFDKYLGKWPKVRHVMLWCSFVSIAAWIFGLGFFVSRV